MALPKIIHPSTSRKLNDYCIIFSHDRCNQKIIPQHELRHRPVEALVRKFILHSADDWFTRFGGMPRQFKNTLTVGDMKIGKLPAYAHTFRRKVTPWRS